MSTEDTGSIKVALRVRPLNPKELQSKFVKPVWQIQDNVITQLHLSTGKPIASSATMYTFDHIYDWDSQTQHIYDDFAKEIVAKTIEGFNGTIFAYGQTSSGKTHTMHGDAENIGIIPLAIADVFDTISCQQHREFLVRVSYMEIYNEVVRDLLVPQGPSLKIHEDLERGVFVGDLKEEVVLSPEDVLAYMAAGEEHRHVGATNMNERSSRSHTIFRMVIESRGRSTSADDTDSAVRVSTLNLVDLAGSERSSATGAEGLRLKEGAHINKSLLTLGSVIAKLSEGQHSHIPYRDSKLTRILQPALGGNSLTAMIATITPAAMHCEESHSTLKFASRAKKITNSAHVNEVLDDAALLRRYRKEISMLRDQLENQQRRTSEGSEPGDDQQRQMELLAELNEAKAAQEALQEKYGRLVHSILNFQQQPAVGTGVDDRADSRSARGAKRRAGVITAARRETWAPDAAAIRSRREMALSGPSAGQDSSHSNAEHAEESPMDGFRGAPAATVEAARIQPLPAGLVLPASNLLVDHLESHLMIVKSERDRIAKEILPHAVEEVARVFQGKAQEISLAVTLFDDRLQESLIQVNFLKKRIRQMASERAERMSEVASLHETAQSLEMQIRQREEQLREMHARVATVEPELDKTVAENAVLQAHLAKAESSLQDARSEKVSFEQDIALLREEFAESQARAAAVAAEMEDARRREASSLQALAELQQQLFEMQCERDAFCAELADLRSQSDQQSTKISAEVRKLEEDLSQRDSSFAVLQGQMQAANEEKATRIAELVQQLETAETAWEESQLKMAARLEAKELLLLEAGDQIANLQLQVASMAQEQTTMLSEVADARAEASEMRARASAELQSEADAKSKLDTLQIELQHAAASAEAQMTEHASSLAEMARQQDMVTSQLGDATTRIGLLSEELGRAAASAAALQEENQGLKLENAALHARYSEEIAALSQKLADAERSNCAEVESLRQDLARLASEHGSTETSSADKAAVESLTHELRESDAAMEEMRAAFSADLADLERRLEESAAQLSEKDKKMDVLCERTEEVEAELEELRAALVSTRKEREMMAGCNVVAESKVRDLRSSNTSLQLQLAEATSRCEALEQLEFEYSRLKFLVETKSDSLGAATPAALQDADVQTEEAQPGPSKDDEHAAIEKKLASAESELEDARREIFELQEKTVNLEFQLEMSSCQERTTLDEGASSPLSSEAGTKVCGKPAPADPESEIRALKKSLMHAQVEFNFKAKEAEDAATDLADAQRQIDDLRDALEDKLSAEIAAAASGGSKEQQEILKLKNEKLRLSREASAKIKEARETTKENQELAKELEKVTRDRDETLTEFETSRIRWKSDVDRLREEVSEMRDELLKLRKDARNTSSQRNMVDKERERSARDAEKVSQKLIGLEERVKNLVQEKSTMERSWKEAQRKADQNMAELERIKSVKNKEELSRREIQAKIARLEKDAGDVEELREWKGKTTEQLTAMEADNNQLREENSRLEGLVSELKVEVATNDAIVSEMDSRGRAMQSELEQLTEAARLATQEHARTMELLQIAMHKSERADRIATELDQQNESHLATIQARDREIDELTERCQQAQVLFGENERLRGVLEHQGSQITALHAELAQSEALVADLRRSVDQTAGECLDQHQRREVAEAALEQLRVSNSKACLERDDVSRRLTDASSRVTALTRENEGLSSELLAVQMGLEKLRADMEDLVEARRNLLEMTERLRESEQARLDSQTLLQRSVEQARQLKSSLEEAQQSMAGMAAKVSRMEQQIRTSEDEIFRLRRAEEALSDEKEMTAHWQRRYEELVARKPTASVQSSSSSYGQLEEELAKAVDQIRELEEEIQELETELVRERKERHAAQADLDRERIRDSPSSASHQHQQHPAQLRVHDLLEEIALKDKAIAQMQHLGGMVAQQLVSPTANKPRLARAGSVPEGAVARQQGQGLPGASSNAGMIGIGLMGGSMALAAAAMTPRHALSGSRSTASKENSTPAAGSAGAPSKGAELQETLKQRMAKINSTRAILANKIAPQLGGNLQQTQ